jgi:hypothetical protein
VATIAIWLPPQQIYAQASTDQKQSTMKKSIRTQWEQTTNTLHMRDCTVHTNASKEALYEVKEANGRVRFEIKVTAFVDSGTGKTYIGPKADFYFESKSGIAGGILADGTIRWLDSLVQSPNRGHLDEGIAKFESQVTAKELVGPVVPGMSFRDALKPWFINSAPHSSYGGTTPLLGVDLRGDILKLDIQSNDRKSRASIWINADARHVTRAAQDNEQTFPKLN